MVSRLAVNILSIRGHELTLGTFLPEYIFVMRQWATRLVYSNRFCRGLYKSVSAIRAKQRSITRATSKLFSKGYSAPPTEAGRIHRTLCRYRQQFSKTPGWFLDEAQVAWDCLFSYQEQQHICGNLMEIGVWRGKSAALSTLHARSDETCVYVDPIMLAEFKDTIGLIRHSNSIFVESSSEVLPETPHVMQMESTFRWIHIDGEHSGESVQRDLTVALGLIAEDGLICIDDFPSCAYPQIIVAVTEFLRRHPQLTMIMCGHNKGYICCESSSETYRKFIRDNLHREMSNRGADVTIWKSGRPSDWNCFGITDRVERFDYRGPDWNPRKIEI